MAVLSQNDLSQATFRKRETISVDFNFLQK